MCPPKKKAPPPHPSKNLAALIVDDSDEEEEETKKEEEEKKENDPFSFKESDSGDLDDDDDDAILDGFGKYAKADETAVQQEKFDYREQQKEKFRQNREREERGRKFFFGRERHEQPEPPITRKFGKPSGTNYMKRLAQVQDGAGIKPKIANPAEIKSVGWGEIKIEVPKEEKPPEPEPEKKPEKPKRAPFQKNPQRDNRKPYRYNEREDDYRRDRNQRQRGPQNSALQGVIEDHRQKRGQYENDEQRQNDVRRNLAERNRIRYQAQNDAVYGDEEGGRYRKGGFPADKPNQKNRKYGPYTPSQETNQSPEEEEIKEEMKKPLKMAPKGQQPMQQKPYQKDQKPAYQQKPLQKEPKPEKPKVTQAQILQKQQKQQVKAEKNKFAETIQQVEEKKEISIRDLPIVEETYDPAIITPHMRRSFYFFDDKVTMEMTDEELRANPQLHMELYEHRKLTPNGPAIASMEFKPYLAAFFVECFAINCDENTRGLVDKFSAAPAGFRLSLPGPFPVSFTKTGETIQACFFDTPGVCGVEVQNQVKFAMDTFSARGMVVYTIEGVDGSVFDKEEFRKLGEELNTVAVVSKPVKAEYGENVEVFVMKTHWNDEKAMRANEVVGSLYRRAELSRCKLCGHSFHEGDGSKCEQLFHPGSRLPFEDGSMESVDENDRAIVRYECCGEVEKGSAGCQTKINPAHEVDRVVSKIRRSEEKIV